MTAMIPGSFDPPTSGHSNLIQRAQRLFDKLYVVISDNPQKKSLLSPDERLYLLKQIFAQQKNVHIIYWSDLIIQFAQQYQIPIIVRGMRPLSDFQYEFEMSVINKDLAPNIETIFLPSDSFYHNIRSSTVKQLLLFNADLKNFVHPLVKQYLQEHHSSIPSMK